MKPESDISQVMKQPVICVNSVMNVIDALQVAKDHNIHHLVVMDNGALEGVVCTCDLRDASLRAPVQDVMHRDVATVSPDMTARQAAELMVSRKVGSVIVTNGRKPVGVVTRLDLSEHDEATKELISECKCAACGSHQHLRSGNDGEYWCVSCLDRATPDGWFDLGTGD